MCSALDSLNILFLGGSGREQNRVRFCKAFIGHCSSDSMLTQVCTEYLPEHGNLQTTLANHSPIPMIW